MTENNILNRNHAENALEQAQALEMPSREEMLTRHPSVQAFWLNNQKTLIDAWHVWEKQNKDWLMTPSESIINKPLHDAVINAWDIPATEASVKNLWTEVAPGVFQAQFFTPEQLYILRDYLDVVSEAKIPLRPPYGIALNRRGAMLDQRSEGFLAAPSFQAFYNDVVNKYMRPVARMLYPEIVGYDSQTFGFSIQYQPELDTSLQPHTDASAVTLNINLNLPEETFEGSEVDFYDNKTQNVRRVSFKPGTALIHRGSTPHATQPITKGKRTNMVLWLYGEQMQIPVQNTPSKILTPDERWRIPSTKSDMFAPF